MPDPLLVDTFDAITFLVGGNATDQRRGHAKYRIYCMSRERKLTRYGNSKRGTARWDLHEIRGLLGSEFGVT